MKEKEIIINKITKWCAYQDRSEFECIQKLKTIGAEEQDIPEIIQFLKDENYLNEERFVKSYINGKMNLKKWGLEKIKLYLKNKYRIEEDVINKALQEINREEYLNTLQKILIRKKQILEKKEKDKSVLKKKIINFAVSKGYDYSSIYEVINNLKI